MLLLRDGLREYLTVEELDFVDEYEAELASHIFRGPCLVSLLEKEIDRGDMLVFLWAANVVRPSNPMKLSSGMVSCPWSSKVDLVERTKGILRVWKECHSADEDNPLFEEMVAEMGL